MQIVRFRSFLLKSGVASKTYKQMISERIRLSINRRVHGTRFEKELTIDFYKIAL